LPSLPDALACPPNRLEVALFPPVFDSTGGVAIFFSAAGRHYTLGRPPHAIRHLEIASLTAPDLPLAENLDHQNRRAYATATRAGQKRTLRFACRTDM